MSAKGLSAKKRTLVGRVKRAKRGQFNKETSDLVPSLANTGASPTEPDLTMLGHRRISVPEFQFQLGWTWGDCEKGF